MTSVAETQPRPASTAKSRDGWLEFFETSSSACNLEESDRKAAALCLKDIKKDLLMSWGDTAYDKVVHKALEPLDVHVVVTIKQDLTGLREDYASRPGLPLSCTAHPAPATCFRLLLPCDHNLLVQLLQHRIFAGPVILPISQHLLSS